MAGPKVIGGVRDLDGWGRVIVSSRVSLGIIVRVGNWGGGGDNVLHQLPLAPS